MKEVTIYTDGACSGNPGPGGFGVVLLFGGHRKELWGGYQRTTNNRMELLAVIKGLEALKERCRVTLYSDSRYVLDALTKGWARRWRANGWRRNRKGELAVNPDLWTRLLDLCDGHEMRYQWVKGHAGDPENERCDKLSNQALARPNLRVDEQYERAERGPAPSLLDAGS
ncbi:MAG: ribonuclease HI [Caldilineaceae bacterium]|nr:ribonuclease HI [Caldilineaceae bacterium]MDE0464539.1 ribonuclease HI [Caldilineaceae bacterium]